MSRVNLHDQSYEEYGRAEGEEFYNSVQRLIKHFQTLDTNNSSQPGYAQSRAANRSGVYYAYDEPDDNRHNGDGWNKLERSRSMGRLGEKERYRIKSDTRNYSGGQKIGAYIALNDDTEEVEEDAEHRPSFVRGAGTRRTFSGITRRKNMETGDPFDENRSDNFRLMSHSQYISSPVSGDTKDYAATSQRSSKHFVRNTPQTASSRSIQRRSRSVPGDVIREAEPQEFRRNDIRSSKHESREQKQVEYVSSSGDKCFPFKKKSHKSKTKGHHYPVQRGAHSDYDESYASEDSVFDTGYDSSASAGHTRQYQRLYGSPRKHVDIRDKYASGIANYQALQEDANVYSVGQEPQIRSTKEGYKMLELDVNVSGFRPEDIQIVTQGKLLQVIAKGVVVKREEQGDSRIYRELKRQFTLPEVANAEYLQGILSPEGILQITGPVGVSTNTKKLKRKRVKFHIE